MNKVFAVLFVLVLCAVVAFAQPNIGTITESGSNNSAAVNQTHTTGGTNIATISQSGTWNQADVDYMGWGAIGVTQVGGGNQGSITQTNPGLDHSSAWMKAGIGQVGLDDQSTITQTGLNQYTVLGAWNKQIGDNNTSTQTQTGGFATSAGVWQEGNSNTSNVTQIAGYNFNATVGQYGNSNNAYQWQDGGGYNQDLFASAKQYGNSNESKQTQVGLTNTATVVQGTSSLGADFNVAWQDQSGNGNTATAYQYSSNNVSKVWQSLGGNVFTSTQDVGNWNTVNLDQTNGSHATIGQHGASNTVMGLGLDPLAISHDGSTMTVTQTGDLNMLHIEQLNGATATVTQTGNNNLTTVIQH